MFKRLFALALLIAFVSAVSSSSIAGDVDSTSGITPDEYETTCNYDVTDEELCGWVEIGTHDSIPLLSSRQAPTPIEPESSLQTSAAAFAAAACATAGVSVEQIVEPFAMVGPYLDDSARRVEKFQAWWKLAVERAESLQAEEDGFQMQEELDAIAALEPIDVESLGPSVLLKPSQPLSPTGIEVAVINPLIGSSPVIATVEEYYMPYDLSAKDIKLWSVLPVSTRPFCIRSNGGLDAAAMWEEFDHVVCTPEPVQEPAKLAAQSQHELSGSADCYLDELVWKVETFLAEDSPVWAAMSPVNMGRRFAGLATRSNRLAISAAQLLASNWPPAGPEASKSGEALLVRAGAIEAGDDVAEIHAAEAQIARQPTVTNLR